MPSKPAKNGIKSWVACDAKSSYAWKIQVYTGKPSGGRPEGRQGLRVVLDVTEGLHVHNVQLLHLLRTRVAAPGEEDHRGRHGSEEQARAPDRAARGQGKRGVIIQVRIHVHRHSDVLHAKEKQERGTPEHHGTSRLTSATARMGNRSSSWTTTATKVAWTT